MSKHEWPTEAEINRASIKNEMELLLASYARAEERMIRYKQRMDEIRKRLATFALTSRIEADGPGLYLYIRKAHVREGWNTKGLLTEAEEHPFILDYRTQTEIREGIGIKHGLREIKEVPEEKEND